MFPTMPLTQRLSLGTLTILSRGETVAYLCQCHIGLSPGYPRFCEACQILIVTSFTTSTVMCLRYIRYTCVGTRPNNRMCDSEFLSCQLTFYLNFHLVFLCYLLCRVLPRHDFRYSLSVDLLFRTSTGYDCIDMTKACVAVQKYRTCPSQIDRSNEKS
jgi:hypothetical protein